LRYSRDRLRFLQIAYVPSAAAGNCICHNADNVNGDFFEMKRYKYTCKNQEQHDLLAGICENLGYQAQYASWKLTSAPVFGTLADGSFSFCMPDSEVANACTEVFDLREMIKFIVGVRRVKMQPKEPKSSWNIGGYIFKWEVNSLLYLFAGRGTVLCIQPDCVKEIYNRGCQLGFIKQEAKEQQK